MTIVSGESAGETPATDAARAVAAGPERRGAAEALPTPPLPREYILNSEQRGRRQRLELWGDDAGRLYIEQEFENAEHDRLIVLVSTRSQIETVRALLDRAQVELWWRGEWDDAPGLGAPVPPRPDDDNLKPGRPGRPFITNRLALDEWEASTILHARNSAERDHGHRLRVVTGDGDSISTERHPQAGRAQPKFTPPQEPGRPYRRRRASIAPHLVAAARR